jgi:hypothetical protein
VNKIFFGMALCLFSFPGKTQTSGIPATAWYTQLNAYSSASADAFSWAANQASLSPLKNFSAGVYGERKFMLQDLSLYRLAIALPSSNGNFGIRADYFGSSAYNESAFGLAYARRMGQFDVGVQFNYYLFNAGGYGRASIVNAELGAILHVTSQFQTGVHFYNPAPIPLGKSAGEQLPSVYSAGFGYDPSPKFFIGANIEKTEGRPVNIITGFQYSFLEKLFVRGGIASASQEFYFGFGFLLDGFRIDVTASVHPVLGPTPGLMLVYTARGKK